MNASELQQELFQAIKTNIPGHLSATEEIAKVLNVSTDSVYRRMRGEKTISLEELHSLCSHYKISLDQLMGIQTGAFTFQGNFLNEKTFRYEAYLQNLLKNIAYFNSFRERECFNLGKDVPIFFHFIFREIAAFKYFFWMKTIFNFPGFANVRFNFNFYNDELWEMGKKIIAGYNELPSVELWNVENINVAIRQIEFYRDGQMFESDNNVLTLYEKWEKVIDHIEKQAERGYKFNYGDPEMKPVSQYKVYFNEVILGDNSLVLVLNGVKVAIVAHTNINYMMTRDMSFSENVYDYIQSLMRRSTLISQVSEKERSKFFRILRERIARRKDALKI
jgi:transcriptional regulator with XRE-family HTH domain